MGLRSEDVLSMGLDVAHHLTAAVVQPLAYTSRIPYMSQ